jgi:hypothetical protein
LKRTHALPVNVKTVAAEIESAPSIKKYTAVLEVGSSQASK